MKRLTTFFSWVLLTLVCAQDPPPEFDFNQSSLQAFSFINSVTINGVELEENDWVAAFNGDICVGARQWDISNCGGGLCDVPLMGDDAEDYAVGYMQNGDIPDFKIYDSSEGSIFDAIPNINYPWGISQFFQIDSLIAQIYGCTDENACNYFQMANIENETCEYPEENYNCAGECLLTIDCFGICGGDAQDVGCGCGEAGPSGCDELCGSSAIVDDCGICNGDNAICTGCMDTEACNYDDALTIPDNSCIYAEEFFDCFGECIAELDCFGICGGDAQDVGCGCGEAGPSGCDELCGSSAIVDDCGICNGSGITDGECDCDGALPEENYDCDGVCLNDTDLDGVCDEDELANNEFELPSQIGITSIYPNPFNPQTTIEYAIDNYSHVRVNIYNLNGVLVESLIDEYQVPGYYSIAWNPSGQSSGIFIINLTNNQVSIVKKLVYIK